MRFREFLNEGRGDIYPWVEPTLSSVKDSAHSLVPNRDEDYKQTFALVKAGKVVRIPRSYFTSNPIFEPFTKKDLEDKDLDSRVKRIVKGFKNGTIPMVLATERRGKIEVYDGFTRAGVAMALGIPIYAKVVTKDALKKFLEAQLPPKKRYVTMDELRAEARQLFRSKMGRDPISDDELRQWSGEELKHYKASSGESKLNRNNDGGPPMNGVSNNRYWQ